MLRNLYGQPDTSKWPAAALDSMIDRAGFQDIGILGPPSYPNSNPYSTAKKQLGKMLFFDARLSASGQIACASCHNPELCWTDNLKCSLGHNCQTRKRNAINIINSVFAY